MCAYEAQHDSGSTFNKLPTLCLRSGRTYVNTPKQRKWMKEMLGWRVEHAVGSSVLVLCWQHLTLALLTHFMDIIVAVVVSAPFTVGFTFDSFLPAKPFFGLIVAVALDDRQSSEPTSYSSKCVAERLCWRVQVFIGLRLVCMVVSLYHCVVVVIEFCELISDNG